MPRTTTLQAPAVTLSPAAENILEKTGAGAIQAGPMPGQLMSPQTSPGTTNLHLEPPLVMGGGPRGQVYTTLNPPGSPTTNTELWHSAAESDFDVQDRAIELRFAAAAPFTWDMVKADCGAVGSFAAMNFNYQAPPTALPPADPGGFSFHRLYRVKSLRTVWLETGRLLRLRKGVTSEYIDFWLLSPDYIAPSIAAQVRLEPVAGAMNLPTFINKPANPGPFSLQLGLGDAGFGAWTWVQIPYVRSNVFPPLV